MRELFECDAREIAPKMPLPSVRDGIARQPTLKSLTMGKVRNSARRSALALTALGLATSATGQIAGGLSGSSSMTYISGEESWSALSSFASCYAARNPDRALALIATAPGSKAEVQTYKAMFGKSDQSCLGFVTELSVPYTTVRGALAEGLYKRRIPLPAALKQTASTPPITVRSISESSRCYAAMHENDVRSLLSTKPGSKKESKQVADMFGEFSKCLPDGLNVSINPTILRYRLAEALYRLNLTPFPVAGSQ